MRVTIHESEIPKYAKVNLEIAGRFCEKEGIARSEASVIAETDLAILLEMTMNLDLVDYMV